MKKTIAILLAILMLFSLFEGALKGNDIKADENYQWIPINKELYIWRNSPCSRNRS